MRGIQHTQVIMKKQIHGSQPHPETLTQHVKLCFHSYGYHIQSDSGETCHTPKKVPQVKMMPIPEAEQFQR